MAVKSCMFVMKVKAVMSAGGSQSYVLKNTTTGFCFLLLFFNSVSFVFSSGYGLPGGHQGHGDRNGKL